MIEALRKIFQFAKTEQKNITKSVIVCFIRAVFSMFEMGAIYFVIQGLLSGSDVKTPALIALIMLVVQIIGIAVTKYFSQLQQTHAGYFMVGNKRIEIGNKLKSVPMGYFNDNSLGEITGVCTIVMDNIETIAPMVLVTVFSGLINTAVFTLMVLIFDWRIGLLVVAGIVIYLLITSLMEKKSRTVAPHRQKSEAVITGTVLEYLRGMSIIKSFNLVNRGDKKVREAVEYNRKSNLGMEQLFTPFVILQGLALQIFSVVMILLSVVFFLNGTMTLLNALMVVVMSFVVFAQIQSTGSALSLTRIVTSSIEQAEKTDLIPELDEKGATLKPTSHDIEFKDVHFSYEKKEILHGINLTIPNKTTTAVIGPSGSGKTTVCNLISRFWDVDSGSITIGGKNIKDYTLESLIDQISMVFQNVYLFADTIENNIKFGRPDATHEEVVAAAKKACCDDFIEALPDGYNTNIGEAGGTLSGGEKQRISIARAMLKDAPIIILDEATANVDPENEDRLQKAIEELTRNKTIIMIAHRLKTVRNADQILVIDEGKITQQGNHDQLISQKGMYADFILGRKEAESWKIQA